MNQLKAEIIRAADKYIGEVENGNLGAEPLRVRGRPLAAWLTLETGGALIVGSGGYPLSWDGVDVDADALPEPGEDGESEEAPRPERLCAPQDGRGAGRGRLGSPRGGAGGARVGRPGL